MPQTTAAINGVASTVSIKVGSGGTYVDISGSTQSIDAATATIASSDTPTLGSPRALILLGNFEPTDVTVNILYTEVASTEAFLIVEGAFKNKTQVTLKWLPKGTGAGNNTIETMDIGYITSLDYPAIDSTSADAIMASFTVRCPGITYTDVA
jgi:hypothetical protein